MTDRRGEAREVLRANRRGGYTVPSGTLYPFQWNWDSAFVAIGLARIDPGAAKRELRTLLAATWPDGTLPHIVFWAPAAGYFPGPDEWGVTRPVRTDVVGGRDRPPHDHAAGEGDPPARDDAVAADRVRTSGITQPPMVVPAVRRVYEATGDDAFLTAVLDPLRDHLEWWLEARAPEGRLVYSRHPWETGMDDSPAWVDPLSAVDPDAIADDLAYERRDRKSAALADQRPTDWDYDRYVALVRQARRLDWDETRLRAACPFRVEDALTNAVFVRACEDLGTLCAAAGGADAADRWHAQADESRAAVRERLWDPDLGTFVSFDRVADRPLRTASVAGLAAAYADVPTAEQFGRLRRTLRERFFAYDWAVPSAVGEAMEPDRYWRGPVWVNTNWLVARGLQRYGATRAADRVVGDTVALVEREGFREYFNPRTGEGRGSDDFAWSAALYLDLTAG